MRTDIQHRFITLPGLLVLVSACSGAGAPTPTPTPAIDPVATAVGTITAEVIVGHISFLASDELMGRDTPSPGLERAAEYIAEDFRSMGLQPGGDEGTFLQRYPYTRTAMVRELRAVTVTVGAGPARELEFGSDYYIIPSQQEARDVPLVYGGPAAAPRPGISEVAAGAVVMFEVDGNPLQGTSEELAGAFQAAGQAGAVGMVLILDETNTPDSISEMAGGLAGAGFATPIPIAGVPGSLIAEIFASSGMDLSEARADTSGRAMALEGVTFTLAAPIETSEHTPPNVVGILPGSDPALSDEYIVFSAHFDHVGVGMPDAQGDSIFNGADDDASGTSVMMSVARAFASMNPKPARSLIFLAVSGEEKGLLGSEYFAANPTVPIEGIIGDINMDMVGRNAPDTVVAIGREFTNLGALTDRILSDRPELGLVAIQDPKPEEQSFFRSDHLNFLKQDIPAIFFTTGDHPDYHKASDHVELIDGEKITRVARLVFYLGEALASGRETPAWVEGGLEKVQAAIAASGGG